MYKFIPTTRDYLEWEITPVNIFTDDKEFSPIKKKLFPGDVLNSDGHCLKSPYRENKNIPGVLILSGKTYGESKQKKLYKCIPDDGKLPSFLVPYKEKNPGFNKKKHNLYVLFEIKEWVSKHPIGTITNVIGEVNKLENYYEYELYSKNLVVSQKDLKKKALHAVKNHRGAITEETEYINTLIHKYHHKNKDCDRTSRHIFSIDPENTTDIDDAMGITYSATPEGDKMTTISIYIANVPLWLTILDLWSALTPKAATIYLPTKKIPMLPEILSEDLCSLKEKEIRLAFAMDLTIINDEIKNIQFDNVVIKVFKNYIYDERALTTNPEYQNILSTTKKLLTKNSLYLHEIQDSHDIVEYYMKLMNHVCGQELKKYYEGIYRSVSAIPQKPIASTAVSVAENMPPAIRKILSYWGNVTASYELCVHQSGHDLLGVEVYAQTTSPIRRFVDIINMVLVQQRRGLTLGNAGMTTLLKTRTTAEYVININNIMRNIKKVQMNCALIHYCSTENTKKVLEGYVLHKIEDEYTIYIPTIKLITYVKSSETYDIYKKYMCSIHTFIEEYSFRKKVRVQLS